MQLGSLLSIWCWIKKHTSILYHNKARRIESEFIGRLPPEIWLLVYDFLNLEDGASLALSNMAMRSLLKNRNLRRLETSQDKLAKARFFLRSDIYMPEYRFCFLCDGYHKRRDFKVDCEFEKRHESIPSASLSFYNKVAFPWVQLTTRSYRYKSLAYGVELGIFEALCRRSYPSRSTNWKSSCQAVITDQDPPHLLLRTPSELLHNLPCERHDPDLYKYVDRLYPPGCQHARTIFAISRVIAIIWQHHFTSNMPSEIKLKCTHCSTEYLIESDTTRVKITVWTDFGDGICPWEGEWAQLTYKPSDAFHRILVGMPRQSLSIEERFNTAFDQCERENSVTSPAIKIKPPFAEEPPAWYSERQSVLKNLCANVRSLRKQLRREVEDEDDFVFATD